MTICQVGTEQLKKWLLSRRTGLGKRRRVYYLSYFDPFFSSHRSLRSERGGNSHPFSSHFGPTLLKTLWSFPPRLAFERLKAPIKEYKPFPRQQDYNMGILFVIIGN